MSHHNAARGKSVSVAAGEDTAGGVALLAPAP